MWEYLVKSKRPVRPNESSDIHPVRQPQNPAAGSKVHLHEDGTSDDSSRSAQKQNPASQRVLDCPVCHVPMNREMIGGVEIDKCPSCAGVFLDKGELAVLSKSRFEPTQGDAAGQEFLIYTPHGLSHHLKSH